jgi:hypothetical protein
VIGSDKSVAHQQYAQVFVRKPGIKEYQVFSEDVVLAVAYTGVEGTFALDVNGQRPVVRESHCVGSGS